jgi:RNA polymerase sigma-70 factor (sigma-E family)
VRLTKSVQPNVEVDFLSLYEMHWQGLVRLAGLLVDDVPSAEDVVQDAFLALHRQSGNLRDPDASLAYLRRCVVNLSRSVVRRRVIARKHLRPVSNETAEAADTGVLLADEHRLVMQQLQQLPRRQREVLVLRYWSHLSEAEIAATLGISAGSVKSAASRGIGALKVSMKGRE